MGIVRCWARLIRVLALEKRGGTPCGTKPE